MILFLFYSPSLFPLIHMTSFFSFLHVTLFFRFFTYCFIFSSFYTMLYFPPFTRCFIFPLFTRGFIFSSFHTQIYFSLFTVASLSYPFTCLFKHQPLPLKRRRNNSFISKALYVGVKLPHAPSAMPQFSYTPYFYPSH